MNDIQTNLPKIIEKFLSGKYYWYVLARQYNTTEAHLKMCREQAIINGIINLDTALEIRKQAIKNSKNSGHKNYNTLKIYYNNLLQKAIEFQKKSYLEEENFSSYSKLLFEINRVSKDIDEKTFELKSINLSDAFEYSEVQSKFDTIKEELNTLDIYKVYLSEVKFNILKFDSYYDKLETEV